MPSAEPKTDHLTLTTERVVIFKDGYGLLIKNGAGMADREGHVTTTQVPDAVLGTFWATAKDLELRSMTASWADATDEATKEIDCATSADLLAANPGKSVTLHLEKSDVAGRIAKVLQPGAGGILVLDDTPGGRLFMPVTDVHSVSGKDLVTQCVQHTETNHRTKKLVFDFGPGAAGKEVALHLFYFAPGLRWLPSYRIETGDSAQAELALQGEVVNDAEDLTNVAADLIVGVPNFRFKETLSPLSLETAIRATAPAQAYGYGNNAIMAQFSNAMEAPAQTEVVAPSTSITSLAPDLNTEGAQDLFAYAVKSISLPKGGRAAVPLWSGRSRQRHLYTADFSVVRGQAGNYTARTAQAGASPLKLEQNQVWHQLELTDDTDVPWTTGAALVMQGHLPLAQEILGYTSIGRKSLLPLTIAVDLRANLEEKEVTRTPAAITVDKRSYTLVRKRGEVVVTSSRPGKSRFRITLKTGGKVTSASDGGSVKLDESRSSDWNWSVAAERRLVQHSDVSWEVLVDSGESRTLTYEVEFYE